MFFALFAKNIRTLPRIALRNAGIGGSLALAAAGCVLVAAGCALTAAGCAGTVAQTPAKHFARVLPRFVPLSVSFVSPSAGWAWGPAWPYSSPGPGVLARTSSFGRRWSARLQFEYAQPGQPGGFSGVRFADARHGWLFGAGLLATTDGGRSWRRISTPGNVLDLETADGATYALALSCASAERCVAAHLYRVGPHGLAPIGPRRRIDVQWFSLVARGQSVYLLSPNWSGSGSTLWASHDRGRRMRLLSAPCRWTGAVGGALAAFSPSGLALACGTEPAAGGQAKSFYVSTDGGKRWRLTGRLAFAGGYVLSMAAADGHDWALAEARDPEILRSEDAGRTWHQTDVRGTQAAVEGWGEISFLGDGHAVAVPWTWNGGVLALGHDGGRSWRELEFNRQASVGWPP